VETIYVKKKGKILIKEIILTIGLPGSGKSTYIDDNFIRVRSGHQILCLDDIRLAMGDVFNRKIEDLIIAMHNVMARAFMERGLNIIVDSTNISKKVIGEWRELADEYEYHMKGIFFDIPIEECMKRKCGTNKLTVEVYERMYNQLEELRPGMENYFDSFKVVKFDEQKGI
jgi:predicted kinase